VVPILPSLIFLVLVLVGCLVVHRCRTLLALRALQIGLVVSYSGADCSGAVDPYDARVKVGQSE